MVLLCISACSKSNLESTIDLPVLQSPVDGPSENNEYNNLVNSLISENKEITPDNIDKLTVLQKFGKGLAHDLALSPDGRHLAVSSQDGIYIYSVPDLDEENFISAGISYEIDFSSDGNLLVASIGRENDHFAYSYARGIIVFDAASGKELWNAFFEDYSIGFLLSPDSQTILVRRERSLDFLDAKSGNKLNTYEDPMHKTLSFQGLSFSNDGSKLAIYIGDTIHYIDAQTSTELTTVRLQHDFDDYGVVAISPDFQYLVNTLPSSVRVWDAQTGEQLWAQTDFHERSSRIFSEDSRLLAIGCENQNVFIMDSATGNRLQELQGEVHDFGEDGIRQIDLSSESEIIVTLSTNEIIVWDFNTGMEIGSMKEHSLTQSVAAVSPDGKLIAAGYGSEVVRVWELESGKLLWEKEPKETERQREYSTEAIKFSSDSNKLIVYNVFGDSNILVYDSHNGNELGAWNASWEALQYFLNGNTIDLIYYDYYDFIDVESGQQVIDLSEFKLDLVEILSWALSPDGSNLAIFIAYGSSEDVKYTLRIWDTESGEVKTTIDSGITICLDLQFSPDGEILSSKVYDATGQTFVLWEVRSGERVKTFPANEGESLLFSQDGQTIFLVKSGRNDDGYFSSWSSIDGSMICKSENASQSNFSLSSNGELVTFYAHLDNLTIWDAESCKLTRDMALRVESVTFSEDGKYLLTGESDGSVKLWGIP